MITNKSSSEWLIVKEFCTNRLAELREQNDSQMDMDDTNIIRGKIEFAKEILDLDKVEIKPDIAKTQYVD